MGVLVDGSIFGPRVKFSKGIINTKEGFKYFPDYIDSTINGVFTDKAGVESGMYIDRARGIILNKNYKGTVTIQRESSTNQGNLYTKKLFGDVELINESGGFAAAAFKLEDMKYLYEHGELPLTDDSRLFLRLGVLEYRISTVRKQLNVYDKDGNDVGDYSPELSLCYNGEIIQRYNLYNIYSSIDSGGSIRLAGSDIAMIVLRIKNIDPTVVLQMENSFGMVSYKATLNGYVNTSGEKSQSPTSFIYIPVFIQANTYTSTSNTKFLIKGSDSNWYEANSDIKIKPIHQLVEKMKWEYARNLFDSYGYYSEPSVTTTLSDYNSDAEPYISNPISFRPAGGVQFAWTYNPVNNIDTDDIIYNSLNARPSDPPAPEPGGDTPADDPGTDYTPTDGDDEVNFEYPGLDPISSNPGAVNAIRPSLTNYIFKKIRYSSTSEIGNNLVLQTMVDGVNNITMWSVIRDLYALVGNSVKAEDIISRIYVLPFEYTELVTEESSAGHYESTPYIGGLGTILHTPIRDGASWSVSADPNYFVQLSNRFYIFDLGETNIQKVFNNYLDYKTSYNLILPYGAGDVEITPDFLFLNSNNGNVKITGYLDIDTGMLIIKVDVNNQLYYETSVNVACDVSLYGNDQIKVVHALSKMLLAGAGIMYKGRLSEVKEDEAKRKSKELIDYRTQSKKDLADYNLGLRIAEMRDKREDHSSRLREEFDLRNALENSKAAHAEKQLELEYGLKYSNREFDRETRERLLKINLEAQAKHDAEMAHYGYTPRGYMKDPDNPNSLYR